jgi:GT2 family glycosyltransferase
MLFVIIAVHNRKEFTKNCLDSLRLQRYKEFKVVIVDDGSTDGTDKLLRENYQEVDVLKGDGNLWWTAATNRGIEFALSKGATEVLTLNNDTIAPENYLFELMKANRKYPEALIGSLAIDYKTGNIIYGGEVVDWKTLTAKNWEKCLKPEERVGLHQVSRFPGRGLLIPKKTIEKLGMFDEKSFPHYGSDYDFTHRACNLGVKIFVSFDAKLLIYPNESHSYRIKKVKSIKNWWLHISDIRGAANLAVFTKLLYRHSPRKYFFKNIIPLYLKLIFGYWIKPQNE